MNQPPIPVSKATMAAVVVLFNSPATCLDAIATYVGQVDRLYLVDNTSGAGVEWATQALATYPTVRHLPLGTNRGIAYALNLGARQAIADGYTHLLTMDDDSHAPANLMAEIARFWNQHLSEPIGIVTPQHRLTTAANMPTPANAQPRTVLTAMTSGNVLRLDTYATVGGFDDALFIDVVDHDFDLKLAVAGFRLVELPAVQLVHRLGTQQAVLGGRLRYVTHSPLRNYYLIRNSLRVGWRYRTHYPTYLLEALRTVVVEVVKIICLEDQKKRRVGYACQALVDAFRKD